MTSSVSTKQRPQTLPEGAVELSWQALDAAERYRRVTWEGLLIIQMTDEYIFREQGEAAWRQFSDATRPQWAGPIGRKLVKDHPDQFTEDIPGALRLMAVYGAEVWGSGERAYTQIHQTSDSEGRLTIVDHGCPQWRAFSSEMRGVFPCHKACGKEIDSVVKRLDPNMEVETTEGRPLGHDECVWRVRRKDSSA